jgi:hypothetical protein
MTTIERFCEVCRQVAALNDKLTVPEVLDAAEALLRVAGRQRSEKAKPVRATRTRQTTNTEAA